MSLKGQLPSKDLQGREWHIYTLSDPRTGDVRYVGWTTRLKARIACHISEARHKKPGPHKRNWIRSLLNLGLVPHMEIVESGFCDQWESVEARWITHFKSIGCDLTNATDGGEGVVGYSPTEETRKLLSIARTGRKHTAEAKAKISAFHKGRPKPPIPDERRKKLSEAGMGRVPSAETREKLSAAQRGKKKRPYTKEERDAASKAHPFKARTHCKMGHEFTIENTYLTFSPEQRERRACRKCRASRSNVLRNSERAKVRAVKSAAKLFRASTVQL